MEEVTSDHEMAKFTQWRLDIKIMHEGFPRKNGEYDVGNSNYSKYQVWCAT